MVLQTYEDWLAIRYGDEIFTVIRDPVNRVISQLNYVLTRIFSNEYPVPSDTEGWRQEFGVQEFEPKSSTSVIELADRILAHRGVVPADAICKFIGNGRADVAAERIVTRDLEVTELGNYRAWCRSRWRIESETRLNESRKFVILKDLTDAQRKQINELTEQDRILHRLVCDRLSSSGKTSLKGRGLLPVELGRDRTPSCAL